MVPPLLRPAATGNKFTIPISVLLKGYRRINNRSIYTGLARGSMRFVITSRVTPLFLSRFNDQSIGHTFSSSPPPLPLLRPSRFSQWIGRVLFLFLAIYLSVLCDVLCTCDFSVQPWETWFRVKIYRFSSYSSCTNGDDKNFQDNLSSWLEWRLERELYNSFDATWAVKTNWKECVLFC